MALFTYDFDKSSPLVVKQSVHGFQWRLAHNGCMKHVVNEHMWLDTIPKRVKKLKVNFKMLQFLVFIFSNLLFLS